MMSLLALQLSPDSGGWLISLILLFAALSMLTFAYQVFVPRIRALFGSSETDAATMERLRQRHTRLSEHSDERDLATRLHDSIQASGDEPFATTDDHVLPGIGAVPSVWTEPKETPPEA